MPKFGPAGNAESFAKMGYKNSLDVPDYIVEMGLDCYEYQCGRGVNIGEEKARLLGEKAKEKGVCLSLHAPYYISMSSVEEEKRLNSVNYILASAKARKRHGRQQNNCSHRLLRQNFAKKTRWSLQLIQCVNRLRHLTMRGFQIFISAPKLMGKVNQLGTLHEVLELCKVDERLIPCIDFGHLNARDLGSLKTKADFEEIFLAIKNTLGSDRLKSFHSHFSKIEYTAGGEKRHLTFEDTVYGPDYEPVMELTYKYGCDPVFICESAGTQAEDAKQMKDYYNSIRGER